MLPTWSVRRLTPVGVSRGHEGNLPDETTPRTGDEYIMKDGWAPVRLRGIGSGRRFSRTVLILHPGLRDSTEDPEVGKSCGFAQIRRLGGARKRMAKTVLMAMSGGVDSSVSAALLCRQGYRVIGLFMITGAVATSDEATASKRCCSAVDAQDAEKVAQGLGIPFYAQDFRREFDLLREDFAREYKRGRTPNPCLRCNQWVKFGTLLQKAATFGADYVATGHYAQVRQTGDGYGLFNGVDADKNQTYFLFTLGQRELSRTLFPVGGLRKEDIRRIAREEGLAVSEKPESQDVCFISGKNYHSFVEDRVGKADSGSIVLQDGTEIGRHDGTLRYTVGQRRGLGVALGERHYVTAIDPEARTVTLGRAAELLRTEMTLSELHWVDGVERGEGEAVEAAVQIRYRHSPQKATIRPLGNRRARVEFHVPESAIAPGQAAVFYRGDQVLGGGIID